MPAYYNEHNRFAAQWLRNLIVAGEIAPGDVDERSITEVQPDDLRGYTQCHFFAGIGGWSRALRLAGWPDDRPVWTGSCPCQPFSQIGAGRATCDERHLWPTFFGLIRERRPASVFGEQVAGAAGLAWLDHVFADLEIAGYAAAAANLPACSVGAPHKRERLFWVGHADSINEGAKQSVSEGHRPSAARMSAWSDCHWIKCDDGVLRPTERGVFPLDDGLPNVLAALHAYGNAIVPQVAAAFVLAN